MLQVQGWAVLLVVLAKSHLHCKMAHPKAQRSCTESLFLSFRLYHTTACKTLLLVQRVCWRLQSGGVYGILKFCHWLQILPQNGSVCGAGSVGTGLAGLTGCTRALFNPLIISSIKHEGKQSEVLDIVFTDFGSSTKYRLLGSSLGINLPSPQSCNRVRNLCFPLEVPAKDLRCNSQGVLKDEPFRINSGTFPRNLLVITNDLLWFLVPTQFPGENLPLGRLCRSEGRGAGRGWLWNRNRAEIQLPAQEQEIILEGILC